MQVILCKNYDEISKKAAEIVAEQIEKKPNSVLGLATGSSPVGMYRELAAMNLDFSKVTAFNLDEYYPISKDNTQSYHYFMNKHLYSKVNLKAENIHIPSGEAKDAEKECQRYDDMIAQSGGIDLQILGIGKNGHIGFNEPSESLDCKTHLTSLTQSTIEANSRFFASEADVPKKAITMGVGAILKAKKIVLIASGADKAHAVGELLKNEVSTSVPASVLNVHRDAVLLCDPEAYGNRVRLGSGDSDPHWFHKAIFPVTAVNPLKIRQYSLRNLLCYRKNCLCETASTCSAEFLQRISVRKGAGGLTPVKTDKAEGFVKIQSTGNAGSSPHCLGIDIGGTNTKFGIVENGNLVFKSRIKTDLSSAEALADGIAAECARIGERYSFEFIGVGVPGTVADGIVTADNLPLDGTPLKAMLEQRLGTQIEIENDANCAGLAEIKCGAGRRYKSTVMLTLGTGIGGSISADGRLMLGNGNMAELGHMIIQAFGGRACPCGQSGCFEQYASVTALVRMAKENIAQNDGSILARMYRENGNSLNGEIIFAALDEGCKAAAEVMDGYTSILAVGIDSLINILDPDAVVLSGGITEHGEGFIDAVQSKIHFKTPVVISELKGDAGVVGAAYLTDLA